MARLRFGRRLTRRWWRDPASDVREELALHVALRTRELRDAGLAEPEARLQAEREVGRPEQVVPVVQHHAGIGDWWQQLVQGIDEIRQDVRTAWRSSRRSPGFTALALLTTALGLGANVAIFGLLNVAVFSPLPFDPDNTLVRVREVRRSPDGRMTPVDASRRTADAVAAMSDTFRASVALSGSGRTMTTGAGAVRVAAMRVGPGFTDVVGVSPVRGRTFTAEEEAAGGAVLISHRFWQTELGGDDNALGRVLRLDDAPFEVVGILPPRFHVPYDADAWFPSTFGEDERNVFILARLATGVPLDQAKAALAPVAEELNRRYPDVMRGLGVTAVSARDFFVNEQDGVARVLMAAVAVLLLIASANVALLLTTRFAARHHEVAVRAALGCSRRRQVRQFVTEGTGLFVVGGLLGLGLARALERPLMLLLPDNLATQVGVTGIPFDLTVITFALGLAVVTGVGFGLLAAMRTTGGTISPGSRTIARTASRGVLGGLVVFEVALSITLVFAAGVMVQAVERLGTRDLGFQTHGIFSAQLDLNAPRYESGDARRLLIARLVERTAALPGVESVGVTTVNPLCCGNWGARVQPEGAVVVTADDAPIVQHFVVTPGYFPTVRRPVIDGRNFSPEDGPGTTPVVIVDQALAERYWPGASAIGKRIRRWSATTQSPWLTVVGVVGRAVEEGDYAEAWYLPHAQQPTAPSAHAAHLLVRGGSSSSMAADLRRVVTELDPSLALFGVTTLDDLARELFQQDRLGAWVAGVFGAGALLLTSLGLYGVLTFVVAGDRKEIAVRRALGASGFSIVSTVLGRGLRLLALGAAAGGLAAWGISALLPRWFASAEPQLAVMVWAVGLILGASAAAVIVPARRALKLEPIEALR